MPVLRVLLLVCLLVAPFRSALAGLKVEAEETVVEGLVLVSAEFGLVEQAADGSVVIKPSDTIPLKEGQPYGWRLRFRTQRDGALLREELQLPVAPKAWDSPLKGQGFKVSPDGRTGITEIDAMFTKGELMNAWQVAAGDPAGDYVVRLFLEGKLVRTFKFKLVAPQ